MIVYQRKLDAATLSNAEPLPKFLWNGDLPLAGDRCDFHDISKYYLVVLTARLHVGHGKWLVVGLQRASLLEFVI